MAVRKGSGGNLPATDRAQGQVQLKRSLREAEARQLSEWLRATHDSVDLQLARHADAQLRRTETRAKLEIEGVSMSTIVPQFDGRFAMTPADASAPRARRGRASPRGRPRTAFPAAAARRVARRAVPRRAATRRSPRRRRGHGPARA